MPRADLRPTRRQDCPKSYLLGDAVAGRGGVGQNARLLLGKQGGGRTDLGRNIMNSVLDTTFEEPINIRFFKSAVARKSGAQEGLGSGRRRYNSADEEINRKS